MERDRDDLIAESVVWFQRRIDKLEAEVSSLLTALVEARSPQPGGRSSGRPTFSGMGHIRTTRDLCDVCGLTGQAFASSRDNGSPIYCPGNPPARIDG